jgi:hypothetical protein
MTLPLTHDGKLKFLRDISEIAISLNMQALSAKVKAATATEAKIPLTATYCCHLLVRFVTALIDSYSCETSNSQL